MTKELIVEIKDGKIVIETQDGQVLKETLSLVVVSANDKIIEIGQGVTHSQLSSLNERQLARLLPIRSLDPFAIDDFHPDFAAFTFTFVLMGALHPERGNKVSLRDILGLQLSFSGYENIPQRDQDIFEYHLSKNRLTMIIKSLSINGKLRNLGSLRRASFVLTTYAILSPLIFLEFFYLLENMRVSIFSWAQFLDPLLLLLLILACAFVLVVLTHFLFMLAWKYIFEHSIPSHIAWEMAKGSMFAKWFWRLAKEGG